MNEKVLPAPSSLFTEICPPCASINSLLMLKPKPVPSFFVPGMRKYGLKILEIYSGGMPCPVSFTENLIFQFFASPASNTSNPSRLIILDSSFLNFSSSSIIKTLFKLKELYYQYKWNYLLVSFWFKSCQMEKNNAE